MNIKQLLERREEAAHQAKAIWDKGVSNWTVLDENRFHSIADEGGEIDQLTEAIKVQEQNQQNILAASRQTLEGVMMNTSFSQERVLPTNGVLPGESNNSPRVYHRTAKIRNFASAEAAYRAGMMLRAITGQLYNRPDQAATEYCRSRIGWEPQNAAYEGSGIAGGYLVPPELSNTIVDVRERVGIARRVCRIQPMNSDTISIPKRAGGLTVYYPNELQTITDSDKTWSLLSMSAEKRAVASKISQELVDDALVNVVDNLIEEMGYALALREDQELINGDGGSTYGGVLGLKNAIGTAGVYTCDSNENLWSEIDLEDVMATMAKLPDRFNINPVWICSSNFYFAVFGRLLVNGGGNGIMELQRGDGGTRSFFGVPVLTTSVMPTADADSTIHAYFGQFDMGVYLADRTGIRIGRDDSTGFLADYTTLKATSRYDMKVHEPGDSSNAGAFVALKTNAA